MASSEEDIIIYFSSLETKEIFLVKRDAAWYPDLGMLKTECPKGFEAYQVLVRVHLGYLRENRLKGLQNRELSPKYGEALVKFASHFPVRIQDKERQFNAEHVWSVTIRIAALDLHR